MLSPLKSCNLCPRSCNKDRLNGEKGFCRATGESVRIARADLHFFEEPPISATRGSGTVFFSYCPLKCAYCQNRAISFDEVGRDVSISELAQVFLSLQKKGAHNINLVTPTHYMLHIIEALKTAKKNGLSIPVIYNTSGYEKNTSVKLLDGYVDVFLTDFKYYDSALSKKYSSAPDYFKYASEALDQMVKQTGKCVFDKDGVLQRGVFVRLLVLPFAVCDSKRVLSHLFSRYKNDIYYSIMNQYTPPVSSDLPELMSPLSEEAYNDVIDFAVELGIENAFIQEQGTASESFIPPFK